MRWYVEVSSIDGAVASDKYCVEAKQWQAALQEARRIRGESGPLSKFSIELMDDGYRAVDPAAQIRYVVNKAPPTSVLSEKGSLRPPTTGTSPRRASAGPPPQSVAPPKDAPVPADIAPPPDASIPRDIAATADAPPAGAAAAQNPAASPEQTPARQDDAPPPQNMDSPQKATPQQNAANARSGAPAGTHRVTSAGEAESSGEAARTTRARCCGAGCRAAAPAAETPSGVGPIRPMAVHIVGDTPSEKSTPLAVVKAQTPVLAPIGGTGCRRADRSPTVGLATADPAAERRGRPGQRRSRRCGAPGRHGTPAARDERAETRAAPGYRKRGSTGDRTDSSD